MNYDLKMRPLRRQYLKSKWLKLYVSFYSPPIIKDPFDADAAMWLWTFSK